jgi:Cellulase (glycosyl hydrolase family 5)
MITTGSDSSSNMQLKYLLSTNNILYLLLLITLGLSAISFNIAANDNNGKNSNNIFLLHFSVIDMVYAAEEEEEGQVEDKSINISSSSDKNVPFMGVNVRGLYTSIQYDTDRYPHAPPFPADYYENSFRLISQAGMNHVRYVLYWEAYEKNPPLFMKELETVAKTADKYGLNILYDNHQYHTSSWLDPTNGTGFPTSLFESSSSSYPHGSGGEPKDKSAKTWWTKWWNRSVKDTDGNDGWILQLQFLKKIVNTVDSHPSTIGYEILNEPQIHSDDQWAKVGKYNTFMVNELRKITQKTIAYSQHIPTSMANNPTSATMTSKNIAKMAPDNKSNVVFKFTLYGLPYDSKYQRDRLNIFVKGAELAGVPLYVGEWNNVKREKANDEESGIISYKIDRQASDIDQKKADLFVQEFKQLKVWGWAFWNWNYIPHPAPNVNLILVREDGSIDTTKYYEMLKNAVSDTA